MLCGRSVIRHLQADDFQVESLLFRFRSRLWDEALVVVAFQLNLVILSQV